MHKVNLPISKTDEGDYKIATPFAAGLTEEDTIREFVSKLVKEMMKGEYEGEDEDYSDYFFDIDTPEDEDEEYDENYQWDDDNPDLRDLGANPKVYENKLRSAISTLIKEELNMKEIEAVGEDAKVKAMTKKIDDEIAKRKKKLKALTTLTELEEDSVNPKKIKELTNDIKKLENVRKKVTKGKKKEQVDEDSVQFTDDKGEDNIANINPGTPEGKKSITTLQKDPKVKTVINTKTNQKYKG